jgi:hypothetical protein
MTRCRLKSITIVGCFVIHFAILQCANVFAGIYLHPQAGQNYIQCEGSYAQHLQGITTNNTDALFWSFTDKLIKTDHAGHILVSKNVNTHHGDMCFVNGKIYVAVNDGGVFNQPSNSANNALQWVYEYDATTLEYNTRYAVPQAIHGAGGIAFHNNKFVVVGGLPTGSSNNLIFEYDSSFQFLQSRTLNTGYTDRGIQTAAFANGNWWFGTYDGGSSSGPSRAYKFNEALTSFAGPYSFSTNSVLNPSTGIESLWDGNMLVADSTSSNGLYTGRVYVAAINNFSGLQVIPIPVPEPSSKVLIVGVVAVLLFVGWWQLARRAKLQSIENKSPHFNRPQSLQKNIAETSH